LDEFSLYPRVQRTRADKLRIISVGRFSEEKGVLETIRAFSIVVEKVKNAELVLIGDGPLWKDAEELALKLGHRNNIKFRGLLHPNSVAQELAMGHIYTQHSREHNGWIEGFGVTITEAGAAGLPVVVSCFGGIVDQVFDGENGFLFPPGDIAAQARFIICLANDEELRREMGMKASQVASSFNSAIQTKKLERLLLELINR
jgi:glycosyltransferase involved in cell wall biosynthesis